MRQTWFRTESTAKLELTVRGQKIPVLAIRSGASYDAEVAFVTTEAGFCAAFRPIPPYNDVKREYHTEGDPVTSHYFQITGTLPLLNEYGTPKGDEPQTFEIVYDYPHEPELKCHDCTPKTGKLFYRRDLVRVPLHDYEGKLTEEAKRYHLGPEDVPAKVTDDYYRQRHIFYLCQPCTQLRDSLNVLAGDSQPEVS